MCGIFDFSVEDFDLMDLLSYTLDLLNKGDTFTQGITLMSSLTGLDKYLDLRGIIKIVIRHRSYNNLIEWVKTLDVEFQCCFIEECIHRGRMKLAWIATKALNLTADYGFTERMYKDQTVKKLVHQKLWGPAMEVAEDCQELQLVVINGMINQEEYASANAHQEILNLSENAIQIDPELLKASQLKERETYLQLSIPETQVLFIEEEVQLIDVFAVLNAQNRVGMDSEWKPGSRNEPASILQLATEEQCFILDMKQLGTSQILQEQLKAFFSNPAILKLGFSFQDDFKAIQTALQSPLEPISNLLDLQLAMSNSGDKKLVSLKHMTTTLLGKPLNKTMQVSNWLRRPLTRPQILYAALDAHVLLLLHSAIFENEEFKQCLMNSETSCNVR